MNSKKAKALRKQAKQYTPHLPDKTYKEEKKKSNAPSYHGRFKGSDPVVLGECTRGAYKALKQQRFNDNR